jgi:TolB protein
MLGASEDDMVRRLRGNQKCQIWIYDCVVQQSQLLLETTKLLLEAPNWSPDGSALIVNGDGLLWRLDLATATLQQIEIAGVPPLNNDHMIAPDGKHIYLSAYEDWQLYRAPLRGGAAEKITGKETPSELMHFLHGVSPDGNELAFVGLRLDRSTEPPQLISAEIFTVGTDGQNYRQITHGGVPTDGPEYAPDGQWIYFNTEQFTGHAQIARMKRDGSEVTRLTDSSTVDWFPHLSPDGRSCVYLAYPTGTRGHPADLEVSLMLVRNEIWSQPEEAVHLFGGQGTINVNSWSPDSTRFAYVAYPFRSDADQVPNRSLKE